MRNLRLNLMQGMAAARLTGAEEWPFLNRDASLPSGLSYWSDRMREPLSLPNRRKLVPRSTLNVSDNTSPRGLSGLLFLCSIPTLANPASKR